MNLKEAKEILQQLNDGYSFSACRVCQNYNEQTKKCDKEKCDELVAIDRVLQELENSISKDKIDLPIKLIEGHFEKLEEYSINHWKNHFAYVEQEVAVKNIRRLIGEIKDLLKEE